MKTISISRRHFTAAMSSLIVVPLLRMRPQEVDLHQLLGMFCDDAEGSRWDLTKPYVLGSHAYATDARIMARIDSNESDCDDATRKIPRCSIGIFDGSFRGAGNWKKFQLAELGQLKTTKGGGACPLCFDRRVKFIGEPAYDRWGEPTGESERLHFDVDGWTIRDWTCELCHGLDFDGAWTQQLGDLQIAYELAHKLDRIPGCEWSLTDSICGESLRRPQDRGALFRSEVGISGVLLAVDPRDYV